MNKISWATEEEGKEEGSECREDRSWGWGQRGLDVRAACWVQTAHPLRCLTYCVNLEHSGPIHANQPTGPINRALEKPRGRLVQWADQSVRRGVGCPGLPRAAFLLLLEFCKPLNNES